MLTRLLSATFGLGVGMVVGAGAVRRFDAVAEAVAPGRVGGAVGRQLVAFGSGVRDGVGEAREMARLALQDERRAELRDALADHAAAQLSRPHPEHEAPRVIDLRIVDTPVDAGPHGEAARRA